MISGFIEVRFFAVSIRVSPFMALLVEAEMLKVSALMRLAAISKERRVRVLGSKKRWITVLPRSVGTFLIGRCDISLNDSAVSRMKPISLAESSSIPKICLC